VSRKKCRSLTERNGLDQDVISSALPDGQASAKDHPSIQVLRNQRYLFKSAKSGSENTKNGSEFGKNGSEFYQ